MANDTTRNVDELGNKAKSVRTSVDDLNRAMGDLFSSGSKGTQQIKEVTGAFDDLRRTIDKSNGVIGAFINTGGLVVEKIPLIGAPGKAALDGLQKITGAFGSLMNSIGEGSQKFISSFDAQTRGLRDFENDMFALEKRFGGTITESKRFADSIRMASTNQLARSLRMTGTEMGKFVRATANTSLKQEQLNQVVQTGAGSIELFGAATAFAAASSMDFSTAAQLLNTLMNKQGKSAQEATNMFGMYVGVAKEAGLSVDDVAKNLNGAVSAFAKIGMAADFGKPILEGFSKTMKDMGLGIEESLSLTTNLTSALAGLSNNYGMAYLTFQRGGLDINGGGGGGVLNSSIALQSAYLEAEKTGDQAAISDQLVRGMRDTVASFTGGDIVTVQQANEDSSLQNQFYIQQQMLKSSYGISDDNTAARVLDMLSRLDDASKTGDADAQRSLREQIQKEVEGRDKTLDEMEKVNRNLETQINLMIVAQRGRIDRTRDVAANAGAIVDKYVATSGMTMVEEGVMSSTTKLSEAMLELAKVLKMSPDDISARGHANRLPHLNSLGRDDLIQKAIGGDVSKLSELNESELEVLIGAQIDNKSVMAKDELQMVVQAMLEGSTQDDSVQGADRDKLIEKMTKALEGALEKQRIEVKVSPTGSLEDALRVGNAVRTAAGRVAGSGGA
tara:strand:+ start:934 stop:2955 length:2022 start_codon:yes stop_codon:yes gene_type:complete